ncbi:MAG: lysophospholipase [Anaerolineales bacterium]|jgi:alpha-beta hydrolase superfamily lysophospholipase
MKHSEFTFEGDGGIQLWGQNWLPDHPARAVFIIVHGLGEHSGRYQTLLEPLTDAGLAIWSYDLRGHGRSAGKRGHILHWSDHHNDLDHFMSYVRSQSPGMPVFLFGHSLGTLIVAEYVLSRDRPLAGVILSSLSTEPVGVATPLQVMIARLLSNIWPGFTLPTGLDASTLSRIPQIVEDYRNDPLVHDRGTVRFATESLDTIDWIKDHADRMTLPLLLVHGSEDSLSAVNGSQEFYEAAQSIDKELWILPGGFHESHNDIESERYVQKLRDWVVKRIPA